MKDLTALELHYLIQEFQFLINARVDKIYAPRKKAVVLQLFVSGKGKHFLRISEKSIYLTEHRPGSETPSEFCMFLRKKLNGARLRKIHQFGFERIVSFDFETKSEKFSLITELFSKGNIILTKDNKILIAAEYHKWKDRVIRPKVEYHYPKKDYNLLKLKITDIKKLLAETKKENIVKCLAIDLGLGGVYAEEACLLAKVNKEKKPNELDEKEVSYLFSSLEKIRTMRISPQIIFKNKTIVDLVPFSLRFYNSLKQEPVKSYNEIIAKHFSKEKVETKEQKRIEKIQRILNKQKEDIGKLEKQEQENKMKAEWLYTNYETIAALLSELKEISKKHSWKEIKEKLKGHKLIKEVIPAEKSVVIELR